MGGLPKTPVADFEKWSRWRPFPDPRGGEYIVAPFGPGVYDVRVGSTKAPVLFGIGGHLAARMASLLPAPIGRGMRNNAAKRQFLLDNLPDIEYRTMACETKVQAAAIERALPKRTYIFRT
jgi:hypothetical protein